ncbi:MAG: hypothetical protein WDM85_00605 [Caulobacteraceae bacterium]
MRALHMRKAREESGQFLAEGLKIVTEAVELGRAPRTLLYGAEAAPHPLLRQALRATEAAGGRGDRGQPRHPRQDFPPRKPADGAGGFRPSLRAPGRARTE